MRVYRRQPLWWSDPLPKAARIETKQFTMESRLLDRLNMFAKHSRYLIALAFAPFAVSQVQLQFAYPHVAVANAAPLSTGYSYSRVVLLANGDKLLVGSTSVSNSIGLSGSPIQHSQIALAALGPFAFPNGVPPGALPMLGGSGNDIPQAAAVDSSGNIWIAGITDSDDFNLVNPIVAQKVAYRTAGFVIELDPTGTKLLFASYLAGQQRSSGTSLVCCYYATAITAIAIDAGGNAYLGGLTNETDFPTTPGAFMTKGPTVGADASGNTFFYSFVVKISSTGKLGYSTLIGTGSSLCTAGSPCVGFESTSATVSSMAVDATDAATAAGVKGGSDNLGSGYVARLSADGSKLLWSASAGANYAGVRELFMAQDSSGNVDLLGQYVTGVTAVGNPGLPPQAGTPGIFAEKLSTNGSTVLYSTDLGQAPDAKPAGIALDAAGDAYLAGTSSSAQFPVVAGVPNLGADFILALDPTGSKPQALFRFPLGTVSNPPSIDVSGQILLPGSTGSLLTVAPKSSTRQ